MNNLDKLRLLLSANQGAVLLTSRANRRYVTGAEIDEGTCLVAAQQAWYFVDARYYETACNQLADVAEVVLVSAARDNGACISEVLHAHKLETVGIEEDSLTYGAYRRLRDCLPAALLPCQKQIDALRQSKQPWELEWMRRAQALADGVFNEMLSVLCVGMTEKEVVAELIYRLYRAGAEGLSFPPIVVSGANGSLPHGKAGDKKLENGDFLTMDFGVRLGGYCSDMTRTVAFGHVTDRMRLVYDTVLAAQLAGIAATKAGVTGAQADGAARAVIEAAGFGSCFNHSYGHSLGLKIHEPPHCSPANHLPLPVGAVTSAEPGIYLPGELGVRIEDVVIVGETGCENITHSAKNLIIL